MLLLLTVLACDPGNQATNVCRDRRAALDALYARYGGSPAAEGTRGGVLGGAVGEIDRARIEDKCLELGRGGHPTFAAKKAKDFFADPATLATCENVVDLEDKLKAINRELPADAQVTCP
ncbi:MAG: hypothetical protein Q8P41_27840 [Pseudomonadota bacterium]|nr:hypothetical protein [Pseudomonadota bacterium]